MRGIVGKERIGKEMDGYPLANGIHFLSNSITLHLFINSYLIIEVLNQLYTLCTEY
jgi:hypothetical protein